VVIAFPTQYASISLASEKIPLTIYIKNDDYKIIPNTNLLKYDNLKNIHYAVLIGV
jgi:hypothetical protein